MHKYVISLFSSHFFALSLERQVFGVTSSRWHCTSPAQNGSENKPPKPWSVNKCRRDVAAKDLRGRIRSVQDKIDDDIGAIKF